MLSCDMVPKMFLYKNLRFMELQVTVQKNYLNLDEFLQDFQQLFVVNKVSLTPKRIDAVISTQVYVQSNPKLSASPLLCQIVRSNALVVYICLNSKTNIFFIWKQSDSTAEIFLKQGFTILIKATFAKLVITPSIYNIKKQLLKTKMVVCKMILYFSKQPNMECILKCSRLKNIFNIMKKKNQESIQLRALIHSECWKDYELEFHRFIKNLRSKWTLSQNS